MMAHCLQPQPENPAETEKPMPSKRTTHRSSAGKKLYAERDESGEFEDVQTYERAHGQDVKRRAKAERRRKR
jgi:hypothetical protein